MLALVPESIHKSATKATALEEKEPTVSSLLIIMIYQEAQGKYQHLQARLISRLTTLKPLLSL